MSRSVLSGLFVASLVALSAPSLAQPQPQLAASENVSLEAFFDRLAPFGNWVQMSKRFVFVPATPPGWKPYTVGLWINSADRGWTWVSPEPFGWATYHYGRWEYANVIGWYWVPGPAMRSS